MTLLPQIWSWYAGFFVSMGMVLALATALTLGILLTHWLYLCASTIESKPTPLSYPRALVRLSGFQALVIGVMLVPFVTITVYYVLFFLVFNLAPAVPPSTDMPSLDFGSTDEIAAMASLVMFLGVLAILIAGTVFYLLHSYAKTIDLETSVGFIKRIVQRYFQKSVAIGFLLTLIACPVLFYFLYNVALLVMYLVPSTADQLYHIAFSGAENIYMRSLQIIGSWFIVVLFMPALWLFLRGIRLRWRYTMENPIMKVVFLRTVKFFFLGLFAYAGSMVMYFLSHSLFKCFVGTAFR